MEEDGIHDLCGFKLQALRIDLGNNKTWKKVKNGLYTK